MKFPKSLQNKLNSRQQNNSLRQLTAPNCLIDFSSNDYLGFAKSETLFDQTHQFLIDHKIKINGATGSRLLSGNHILYQQTELLIATFHQSEAALIFNSGYDANLGFFNSVPQRNDIILYDELVHASIRDGLMMSKAKSYKYEHNNFEHLEQLIKKFKSEIYDLYIVTESVFSMDGDTPNLNELTLLSTNYNCHLVIDEAHALGVFGNKGEGMVQQLHLQNEVFARIITFGKGLGCHGAAIVGSNDLKNYLINFARSFIYTTGLSPHSVASIYMAYQELEKQPKNLAQLRNNINFFNQQKRLLSLKQVFIRSKSAIQSAIFSGNDQVKNIALEFQKSGFDVKPILSPTVPEGQERLRFCLHNYNTEEEIFDALQFLCTFVF